MKASFLPVCSLAISEFNTMHTMRKLSPIYGLRHYVMPEFATSIWPELLYFLHIFDHPSYNRPDTILKPMTIGIEGNFTDWSD